MKIALQKIVKLVLFPYWIQPSHFLSLGKKTLFGLHYGEIINSAPKLIQTIPHTVLQEHMHLVKSLNLN